MTLLNKIRSQSDLILVFAVVGILLILFAPIPAAALDLFIIINFAFAFTILLLTFYVARPVDFSTFPSLLLIATLFRLSLNIAATRLILSGAEAGHVIGSIGQFVVQGNFVIGLIIFFILIVVQYVVVTSGAQRVSEVAARFVLDAMPGQQMSIDADLNMGLIDQDEAKKRRKALEKEAGFYGSMDGASKFVKGDAVAGIIILLIDILGGWAVGVAQMGMPWGQAIQTFTLLTVGDGIVTQVPALIISVATAIIVTRSASDSELSGEVLRQLIQFPKIQVIVMGALVCLLALPGMPKWPVLILATLAFAVWMVARKKKQVLSTQSEQDDVTAEEAGKTGEGTQSALPAIEIVFGAELATSWLSLKASLNERLTVFRQEYASDMGMALPMVVLRGAGAAAPMGAHDYRVLLFGNRYAHAEIYPEKTLAISANVKGEKLPGTVIQDPAFGLPAIWIEENLVTQAKTMGYTIIDPITVFITHVTQVIKANAPLLLSRGEVMQLLDGVRNRQPGLVEELVPNILAISDVQHVLQGLLTENVSIRHIDLIIETLADVGRHEKDPAVLGERVRQKCGHAICLALQGDHDQLSVLTIEPSLETAMLQNVQGSDANGSFLLDPRIADTFLSRLSTQVNAMMRQSVLPVVICRPEIRRHLKSFSRRVVPHLTVLSMNEVPMSINLKSFGLISMEQPAEKRPAVSQSKQSPQLAAS